MPAPRKHREAILASAVKLFRRQGYAATGLAEILSESGAPKGSLYHYFPGGKSEIGAEAVTAAGAKVAGTLDELATRVTDPGELVAQYLTLMAGWMAQSGFRDGCPITTTLLETVPQHEAIHVAGRAAFGSWVETIARVAHDSGIAPDRAATLARFSISALEGALIQCRVSGDESPLVEAAVELKALFQAARAGRSGFV